MSKLSKLKKKYEASDHAEEVAWKAWQGQAMTLATSHPNTSHSDYDDALVHHELAFATFLSDSRAYRDELNRYWRVVGKVLRWVYIVIGLALLAWYTLSYKV